AVVAMVPDVDRARYKRLLALGLDVVVRGRRRRWGQRPVGLEPDRGEEAPLIPFDPAGLDEALSEPRPAPPDALDHDRGAEIVLCRDVVDPRSAESARRIE